MSAKRKAAAPRGKSSSLSHKERVLLALNHRETDRVPMAIPWINQPTFDKLNDYLRQKRGVSVKEFLKPYVDIKRMIPAYIGPALPADTDVWGVKRIEVSFGEGSYDEISHYPLKSASSVDDVLNYHWPSPDWYDYGGLKEKAARYDAEGPYCLMARMANIFESSWYLRGFEQFFCDLALNPDFAHAILSRVTDFFHEYLKRLLDAVPGKIDLVFTADDIAGQRGLLMSSEMWSANIKPYHQKINRLIHDHGAKVIYHSCGAVMDIIPGLIDMGVDVLQPLQFDADGMDPALLKNKFGNSLCFEGGVSVQHTLPFGTQGDVRSEVVKLIDILAKNGGYILGPAHAIQAGTPVENIITMYETAGSHRLS